MEKATRVGMSLGSATYGARRAADIVAVLQNKERLEYRALVSRLNATFAIYGEHSTADAGDLDELRTVARKLYAFFEAQDDVVIAASLLNEILQEYAYAPRLSAHGNNSWHLHVDSSDHAPWAEWFAASSAVALAVLFAEKQRNPGGLCASPSCGKPFIDMGKGGGRSYCSPRCATRERVATYRKNRRDVDS